MRYILIALLVGCSQQPQPLELLPMQVIRSEPDEYGVVCYSKSSVSSALSCVQVQFDENGN